MNLHKRLVRYQDLKPCLTAFIDTRSPGSDKKENFTIIGPGVAENPDQHVHIGLAHGFNIGGARQPPGCLNSQHSHLTNEVFVVHSGTWAFRSGVTAEDGEVVLHEGDVISLPPDVFRGFENVGEQPGYLYAILGEDDPGRVLWAPQVFDLAEDFGLSLMEDGSLVDTAAGESLPEGVRLMPRASAAQVEAHRIVSTEQLSTIVISRGDFHWSSQSVLGSFDGVLETPLLGPANPPEQLEEGALSHRHGFVLRALQIESGAKIPTHSRAEEEVLFVQQGRLGIDVGSESLELGVGDVFTTPIGAPRSFRSLGSEACIVYVTRRGDQPQAPEFED
jgi:mannose-6-phosphate isomerase-like protein (cupin superfamily)